MKIVNLLAKVVKTWVAYYKKTKIILNFPPRKGVCDACGRKGRTQRHHWKYAFQKHDVKQNPKLVLKYTREYDFHCHQLADVIRRGFQRRGKKKTVKIVRVMFRHIEEVKEKYEKESKK